MYASMLFQREKIAIIAVVVDVIDYGRLKSDFAKMLHRSVLINMQIEHHIHIYIQHICNIIYYNIKRASVCGLLAWRKVIGL